MAAGDDAAAAGLDVMTGYEDRRLGYQEINKTRDMIAERTSTVTPVAKGGTGASDAATARTNLSVYAKSETYSKAEVDNHNWDAGDIVSGVLGRSVNAGYGGSVTAGTVSVGTPQGTGGLFVGGTGAGFDGFGTVVSNDAHLNGAVYAPSARNSPVASNFVAAYLNGDGRLGASPSTRRLKKEIRSWSPDVQAVFAMRLVTFRYKAEVYGNANAPVEVGMIAEELVELGLGWLVYLDDQDRPAGIHYERVALALLPAVQNLNDRVTALEEAAR